MKFYHGSTKDIDISKPHLVKGTTDFENVRALFLTDDFTHAALYAIGKTLRGKTASGITGEKLIIVGDTVPEDGYVYELDVDNAMEDERGHFAFDGELWPVKKTKVLADDYLDRIVRVEEKEDLRLALG